MRGGQQLTLVGLLTILVLIGCGGFIGAGIGELIGLIGGLGTSNFIARGELAGSLSAFLLLIFWGAWFRRMDRIHPPCKCGNSDWENFDLSQAEGFRNVWQCSCGKKYSWPKWQLWFEIRDDGTTHLFMTRNHFRSWRKATEKQIARQSSEITRVRQQRAV